MSKSKQFRARHVGRFALVAAVAGIAVTAIAENVVVKKDVQVFADKSTFSPIIGSATSNTSLEKLGIEGGWIHVRTADGKDGYIQKTSISSAANARGMTGSGQASSADAAAAARGLEPETETYARSKHMSPKDAQQVVDWGKAISIEDLKAFAHDGHVGPKQFRD